jgi:hypothetical protein
MNKAVVGFVAGAVVVGAAGYGTMVYPQQRAKQQIDQVIAALPSNMHVSYQTLQYSLFSGKLSLGGFEMSVTENDETMTAKLATITARDFKKGHVGELRGNGLTIEDAAKTMRFEAEELAGEGLEGDDGVLRGMGSASPLGVKRLALTGITLNMGEDKAKLREVVLADYRQTDKVPVSMTLGVHGMLIEPQSLPDADAREGLAKLGYDKLSLNFDLSYAHNPETKRLSIKQASIGGDNIGQLSVSMDLGGIETTGIDDPMIAMAAAQMATLERAELRYDDASLTGRILKLAATEAEMDETQFKSTLLTQLAQEAPEDPLAKQVVDSATAFLTNPKSLSLNLKPARPLPLVQLMGGAQDPYALANTMGMSVSANR